MAQLIIDVPDPQVVRVLDALSARWGYEHNAFDGETKAQYIKRYLANLIRQAVLAQELDEYEASFMFNDPGVS